MAEVNDFLGRGSWKLGFCIGSTLVDELNFGLIRHETEVSPASGRGHEGVEWSGLGIRFTGDGEGERITIIKDWDIFDLTNWILNHLCLEVISNNFPIFIINLESESSL